MKTTKNKAPKQEHQMLVNVVLDRSGSMLSTQAGTVGGYNEYLNGLRADKDTEYFITLIQFDSSGGGPDFVVSYKDKPLDKVPELTSKDYNPRGMTPLYDAIGESIRRVEAKGRPVTTVIITDGMENASREFSSDGIKMLISAKEAEGWKFAFLGANIDAFAVGRSIGFRSFDTSNYVQGQEKTLYANLAQATMVRSSNVRSMGIMGASNVGMFSDEQQRSMGGASTKPIVKRPVAK